MYGVFKSYKADAPETKYVAILKTEEEAQKAVERMRQLQKEKRDTVFAYTEGWEWRGRWEYEKVPEPISLREFDEMIDTTLQETEDEFSPQGEDNGEE